MTASPTPVLAGNWKLNHGPAAAREFMQRFLERYPSRHDRQVVFFPPALSLAVVAEAAGARADVAAGVQHVYWEESGAFTGEISSSLAAGAGARYALVGHSERRQLFGETVPDTVRKVAAVLAAGLNAVLCVGETIEERRAGRAQEVVAQQLDPVLQRRAAADAAALLVAYEPVWAIGTGETATPDDAAEMHAFVRGLLERCFGEAPGRAVPILYGGSVKPDNAGELLRAPDVDGVLVGGASLDPLGFARICEALP